MGWASHTSQVSHAVSHTTPGLSVADLLIVVGSRSLAGSDHLPPHPTGRAEVERAIRAEQVHLPRPTILSGGADGVDRWSRELAERDGLPWVEYLPEGIRRCSWEDDRRWSPVAVHPLVRNERIIRAGTDALARGYRVRLIAVVDDRPMPPGVRATRGADQCLGLGERAGLVCKRWPVV